MHKNLTTCFLVRNLREEKGKGREKEKRKGRGREENEKGSG